MTTTVQTLRVIEHKKSTAGTTASVVISFGVEGTDEPSPVDLTVPARLARRLIVGKRIIRQTRLPDPPPAAIHEFTSLGGESREE